MASAVLTLAIIGHADSATEMEWLPGPTSWKGDMTPILAGDWNYDCAEHLLGRAGFGGTPAAAVRSLAYFDGISNDHLQPFVHSGFRDGTPVRFSPGRPAAADLALG